ncbi:MAG: hypothetical protein DMG13_28590 [Acidobacteria bacterium]|nr:MAG: hypothetical protein DMG13_28590 [Acidobacteriota bacterium]
MEAGILSCLFPFLVQACISFVAVENPFCGCAHPLWRLKIFSAGVHVFSGGRKIFLRACRSFAATEKYFGAYEMLSGDRIGTT